MRAQDGLNHLRGWFVAGAYDVDNSPHAGQVKVDVQVAEKEVRIKDDHALVRAAAQTDGQVDGYGRLTRPTLAAEYRDDTTARRLSRLGRREQRGARNQPFDPVDELFGLVRLGDKVVGARLVDCDTVFGLVLRAYHQDWQSARRLILSKTAA